MGREIKRVPVDFDWELNKVWEGFISPDSLDGTKCPDCTHGYSQRAEQLRNLWYGYTYFDPRDNGSTLLTPETPAVRDFAERNVRQSPDYYGTGELAIRVEAMRLCGYWNGMWCHHVNADDVAALVEAGRLMDFTHTFDRDRDPRWQAIEPPVVPTPEQVNEWCIRGMGHDAINCSIVIRAVCEREGAPYTCATCDGHSSLEAYPGQRADADAWEPTEPPTGDGWQLWETVSEGSPISPVFDTAEGMAQWLTTPANSWGISSPMTIDAARAFVGVGWAPSMIMDSNGVHEGADFIGTSSILKELDS